MNFLALIPELLDALAAIPKIGDELSSVVNAIVSWWASKQTATTLADIADAANLSANAKTQEDRFAASAAWQKALQRQKVGS